MTATPIPAHEAAPVDQPDSLFAALDQRVIDEGSERWVSSVLGIHGDECEWWIDLASPADASANVIVHVSRRASLGHILAALRCWRRSDEPRAQLIHVMCMRRRGESVRGAELRRRR
jgi:hypothetical protein